MAPSPSVLDTIKLLTLLLIVAALSVNKVSAGPTDDRDGDGVVDTVDLDDDNDGIPDRLEIAPNGAERDSDGDGMPDRIDLDSDNDGILDLQESGMFISLSFNNVRVVNGRLLAPVGENGIADFLETFPDSNTPAYTLSNTDEADGDVVPDYLDLDSDNDGILDLVEAGVSRELDADRDGRIDAGPGSVGSDGILDLAQLNNDQNCCDYDLDGIGDEIPINSDGGDLPDYQDLDSDNDGFNDLLEAGGVDMDQDGRIDSFFDDANNPDGVDDELFLIPLGTPDTNDNGIPDYRDPSVQFVAPQPSANDPEPADTTSPEPAGSDTDEDPVAQTPDEPGDTGDTGDSGTTADGLILEDPASPDNGIIETGLAGGTGCSIAGHPGKSGSGFDPVLLLMLLIASGYLLRARLKLTSRIVTPALLATLALFVSGTATAFEQRFYAGFAGGTSRLEPDTSQSTFNVNESASRVGSIYLGWDYSARMSVEGYYAGLGSASLRQAPASGSGRGSVDYRAMGVSALAYFFSFQDAQGLISRQGLSLFGGAGLGLLETNSSLAIDQQEDVHMLLTLGAEYGARNGLAARLQVDGYDRDALSARLGVLIRFGSRSSRIRAAQNAALADAGVPAQPANAQANSIVVAQQAALEGAQEDIVELASASANPPPLNMLKTQLDSDNDGVVNSRDVCAGTVIGSPVNETGCPYFEGRVEGVTFAPGSADIESYGRRVLDNVATKMLLHPDIRIEVQAHTDNQGGADGNLQLSKRRALTVTRYLVARGIDKSRLQPQAYGESKPVASNQSEGGRQLNRRIEFRTF